MITIEPFWPEACAFLDITKIAQSTDGQAYCTAVAICDAEGNPASCFFQGQEAHFFYEFEAAAPIAVPSGGLEFHNAEGVVIHGKNSFQHQHELPNSVERGERLRFHHIIQLDVSPGQYWISVGFVSTDTTSYRDYALGAIGHLQFSPFDHCRAADVGSFTVRFDEHGKLRHHGAANLKGDSRLTIVPAAKARDAGPIAHDVVDDTLPTIVHVTHWKAGSQWLHKILNQCAGERIVSPQLDQSQFLTSPIRRGTIFPTVYVTKHQYDRTRLPSNTRRFVVIRDLRDTLVSAYFSMKISHPVTGDELSHLRPVLQNLGQEDGMLYMIDNWLYPCAAIQYSWLEANEPLIRYEDLLEHDLEILEDVLLGQCELHVDREQLRQAIIANRFENVTGGRKRGSEDISAHERKGIVGDWRNCFTKRVKQVFKNRFGGLLVATGYESDLNW